MRKLTARGISLAALLRRKDYLVYEGYPGASQDILGIPRKSVGTKALAEGLRSLHIKVDDAWTHDELDAITCAYVGALHLKGKSELIGSEEEGLILLTRRI